MNLRIQAFYYFIIPPSFSVEKNQGKCVEYGKMESGYIDYVKGANIAGFIKVADAIIAEGVL